MIINKLPAGGGFQLPPVGTVEDFTFETLTEPTFNESGVLTEYGTCSLTGFNFQGNVNNSVTIPNYLGNYKITKISNIALNTGTFGTLTKIVIPFDFEWQYKSTSNTAQKINSQILEITANFPRSTYSMFYNSNVQKFTNNVQYTNAVNSDFYGSKIIDYTNIVKYITSVEKSSFANSNVKGIEFESLTTLPTTSSNDGCFRNCNNIINANFPELTVISGGLGSQANTEAGHFNNCQNLNSIRLPKCTYIGAKTFMECRSLNSIYLEEVPTIEFGPSDFYSPFRYCGQLKNIYIPEDKVDALKEVFNSAAYSNYGTNLAQYVKPTPPLV